MSPFASVGQRLAQKCLSQPAIDRNEVAGRATRLRTGQEQNCRGAIGGFDRLMRERTPRIEFRERRAQS